MVTEHTIQGSKDTSFYDLGISLAQLNINISKGSYYKNNTKIFEMDNDVYLTIPQSADLMHYEIWITQNGFSVLTRKDNEDFAYNQLVNQIDRIGWLSVPANCTDLNSADVHIVKVVN